MWQNKKMAHKCAGKPGSLVARWNQQSHGYWCAFSSSRIIIFSLFSLSGYCVRSIDSGESVSEPGTRRWGCTMHHGPLQSSAVSRHSEEPDGQLQLREPPTRKWNWECPHSFCSLEWLQLWWKWYALWYPHPNLRNLKLSLLFVMCYYCFLPNSSGSKELGGYVGFKLEFVDGEETEWLVHRTTGCLLNT